MGEDNPQIRWGELKRAQETEYKSNGRNPFSMIAPPSPEDVKKQNRRQRISHRRLLRRLHLRPRERKCRRISNFLATARFRHGSPRRAFITDGEDIFIVSEGDTLLGRYRILKVGNSNLEFQEISSGLPGSMPLDEQAAPPSA